MNSKIIHTKIAGLYEIESLIYCDNRGKFFNIIRTSNSIYAKTWGKRPIKQINISQTEKVGSVRGLHFQEYPNTEAKLVRCIRGRVWDVGVDVRTGSKTYGKWHAVELTPNKCNALLIPEGCAHGFQVLEQDSQLLYVHSSDWVPEAEKGFRYDDPTLSINWPLEPLELSSRDQALPFI